MAGKKSSHSSCKPRKQCRSRSSRAGLQFSVSRVERSLREGRYARRLSTTTPVFLAGVLEYLMANILEQAGKEAENSGMMRITPEHVQRALQKNEQLRQILKLEDVTQSQVKEVPQREEEKKKKGGLLSFRALWDFIRKLIQLPKFP
ncbi:histone H2A-like 3 [Callithrix jacchus]|uniref:histone H2A-like 3 n=1 Tax=Callithrix jacchus TaxID=9483 RepID=UPI000265642B|nr:histone H2A-like 3 [Callithrix jacchus]